MPVYSQHIPKALWDNLKLKTQLPIQHLDDYYRYNNELLSQLSDVNVKPNKLKIYGAAPMFCKDTCMLYLDNGRPVYFDSGHLTLSGAALLEPVFDTIFANIRFV